MLPKEDRSYATRSELMDKLKTLLGGRVAEEVVLKEISTGAQNDIQRASQLVRSMITQYGMSDVLGPISFGEGQDHQVFLGRDINHQRNYSEEVASEIDKEVRKYMDAAYEECRTIIEENLDKLTLIAEALIEYETLEASELEELMTTGTIAGKTVNKEEDPKDGTGMEVAEASADAEAAKNADTRDVQPDESVETMEPKMELNLTSKHDNFH